MKGQGREYSDHPVQRELVVEVAESSLAYDTGRKADLYASTGVLDYWVVDLVHRKLIVFRKPEPSGDSEFGSSFTSREELGLGECMVPLASPNNAPVAVADLLP